MNKTAARLLILLTVLVTIPVFFITIPLLVSIYNGLVKKRNKVDLGFSSIDVMLKKRSDLIPNLVSVAKEFMRHEKELLENITALRSKAIAAESDSKERFEAENLLSGALGQLNVAIENYPELKSNENTLHLQRSLNETEEQVSAARRSYNVAVEKYNNAITTVPGNMLAAAYDFRERTYFEASDSERATPDVGKLFA